MYDCLVHSFHKHDFNSMTFPFIYLFAIINKAVKSIKRPRPLFYFIFFEGGKGAVGPELGAWSQSRVQRGCHKG